MTEWQDLGQVRPSNQEIIDMIYPVGAIYISVNSANPATLFGGTWQQLTDTFLYASTTADDDVTTAPSGQGEATHTLTEAELPNITGSYQLHGQESGSIVYNITGHATGTQVSGKYKTISTSTSGAWSQQNIGFAFGSGQAHENMPPYMKVYMWKRTE